ncbi:MAG: type II toxin-antitoxin system PemK/MazF family toxin [Sedimentisphaerales bacterium]|nr:type II toxin-antitoxin system PemK/MazF family toxin [Sedimentisphaerales bacterium]
MAGPIRRGEVRWYKFASPDKRRPVVILTRDSIIEYLGEVTIAPITTTIRDIPTEVMLTRADGVPKDCAVNCDHIQTVAKGKIGPIITTLTPDKMDQLRHAIAFALNL